jgi:hypothetical protein
VEGRQCCEVSRRNRAGSGAVAEVAGQLRPPGGLQAEILTRDDCAAAGQAGTRLGKIVGQFLNRRGKDAKRQMVLAEHKPIGLQIIHSIIEFLDLRSRLVSTANHLVLLTAHDGARVGLRDEREGLRQDELERAGEHIVEHAGPGARRIFLEAQHTGIATRRFVPDFDRFAADDDAVRVDRRGDGSLGQWNWFPPTADELMQHLARLRNDNAIAFVEGQNSGFEAV